MENPYVWPLDMMDEWQQRLRSAHLNRYPDPACHQLKSTLKTVYHVPQAMELLLGNGSDEIIQILLMALKPGSVVMAPEPTFVMYRQVSLSLGLRFVGIPLEPDSFALDVGAFTRAIEAQNPAIIFLAYPNNPTGNLFERSAIEAILSASKGLVVIDEAYAAFAGASFMAELPRHPGMLVMRTLSKLGLAGLRLGFMAGAPGWIQEFDKIRLPYNINVLTQISVQFAMERHAVFDGQIAELLEDRQQLLMKLGQIEGLQVFETDANFILVRLHSHPATEVFLALREAGILIKNLHPNGGLLSQCLRITVGRPEENARFIEVLSRILNPAS